MPSWFAVAFQWAGTIAPLAAQAVLDISQNAGVNHQTVATRIATWVLSIAASKAFHAAHS